MAKEIPLLLKLFLIFFKIGAFTIGGAYAMIPLIRRDLVQKQKWISDEDFLDALAAAQSSPGPIAANLAVYLGFKMKKLPGVFVSLMGTILPSFMVILVIAIFFGTVADLEVTRRIFHGLKPAVVALIVVPVLQMSKAGGVSFYNMWFPVAVALLVSLAGTSPVWLILGSIVYAVIKSIFRMRKLLRELD